MEDSYSSDIGQPMNSTAVKLLQASEFVGGDKQLAVRLGIAQSLLGKLMAGHYHVPAPLLLQVVDIVLAHRQSLIPVAATRTSGVGGDSSQ
jgi:DNA-binding transcriptional regulator YdaS (Cro superfamily)